MRDEHGLVPKRVEELERLVPVENGFGCLQVEGPAKRRALRGRGLLSFVQELPRPIDGLVERGPGAVPIARAEQREAVSHSRQQGVGVEHPTSTRGELDRQWHAVELARDRRHGFSAALGVEVGSQTLRPLFEERDGRLERQGRELEQLLAAERERGARCDDEERSGRRPPVDERSGGVDHLFQIVEDHHAVARDRTADGLGSRLQRGIFSKREAEASRDDRA